jgi:hypothetical protein
MPTHDRADAAPRRALPSPLLQLPDQGAELLKCLGAIKDEDHIVLLDRSGPDLMCALLRAGATQVTHLRLHQRPEVNSASLVIVPDAPSLDWLASVLPPIRRALIANGRLVACIGARSVTQNPVRRMLTFYGFAAIHCRRSFAWSAIRI